jgi:hypothetical protein
MTVKSWSARTRQDLIIEVWEDLDCESVGARELEQIQHALREKFGEGALESPASIARTVADEGAVLRHSEVFACDVKWRKQNLAKWSFREGLDFADLSSAFKSVVKLEEKRLQLQADNETKGLQDLRDIAAAARKDLLLQARSKIIDEGAREQLKEISQWLAIWLQSAELFSDWLELRRLSLDYRKRFSEDERKV